MKKKIKSNIEPVFQVGTIAGAGGELAIVMPDAFRLSACYRVPNNASRDIKFNAHFMAALGGRFPSFIPVMIDSKYDDLPWANLPTVDRIKVHGEFSDWGLVMELDSKRVVCAEQLSMGVHCSDGTTFFCRVHAAHATEAIDDYELGCDTDEVPTAYFTTEALDFLDDDNFRKLVDGEKLDEDFHSVYRNFRDFVGEPDERVRRKLMLCTRKLADHWRSATVFSDGRMVIVRADGSNKTLTPPVRY